MLNFGGALQKMGALRSGNRHSFAASEPRAVGAPATREPLSYAILRIAQKGGSARVDVSRSPNFMFLEGSKKSDFFGNFTPKNPKKLVD